jgi:predicted alpha/beta-hydrolase family hydrolase
MTTPHGDDNLERDVAVQARDARLQGTLGVPNDAVGVVLFAHGSGSSRLSPRNRYVARQLRDAGLATLLMDLLTPQEEEVDALPRVAAPTLLIVGERDDAVIALNEAARARMRAPVDLVIVRRATHLFEEPGALGDVARAARDFLVRHLGAATAA